MVSRDFHKVPQNGTELLFYNFDILHDDQSSMEIVEGYELKWKCTLSVGEVQKSPNLYEIVV